MIAKRAMTTMAEEEDTGQLLPLPPPPREAKTKRMDTILAAQKGGCKSIPKPAATTEVTRQAGDHYRKFSFKGERFDDSRCRRNTVVKENESEREREG